MKTAQTCTPRPRQASLPTGSTVFSLARLRERVPQRGGRGQGAALKFVLLLLLLLAQPLHAAIESQDFESEGQRQRFYQLTRELRCPKCQNQDIADSGAPIAVDLRREIKKRLDAGDSNEQITQYLVARYGEFVRYKPALNAHTWLLWFGPALLLFFGLLLLALLVRRRSRLLKRGAALSPAEQAQLKALLASEQSPEAARGENHA